MRIVHLVRDGRHRRLGTRKGDDPMPAAHSEPCAVESRGWANLYGDGPMPRLRLEAGERREGVPGILDCQVELTVAEARALAAQLIASADAAERGT